MILKNKVKGKNILFRTAEPDDAKFILSLRLDPVLGKYLKPTDPSVEKQKEWIKKKKDELNDYHMIVEDNLGERLGVIAIYETHDIKWKNGDFDWGRWLISPKAPYIVAFESMILLYAFGFFSLKLNRTLFEVRINNKRVLAYHNSYGAKLVRVDEKYNWFEFTVDSFLKNKKMAKYKNLF